MRGRGVRGTAGFSLIEVVLVMALIAILAGIATLSLTDFLPSLRLKKAGQELQLQIQKARLEAVRRSRDCHVEFHKVVGGTTCAPIIWVDENGNGSYDSGEEVYRQPVSAGTLELEGFGGIRFDAARGGGDGVTFAGNRFAFNGRGVSDQAGSIFVKNSAGRGNEINVTLGGAIRLSRVN